MDLPTVLRFLGGFALLLGGAELLVRGASRLARAMGVSPLVVGLTVVAFGTSSPEIAVSVGAVLGGTGDIAFGNVVGSNIANILLVLGLSAAVAPLVVHRDMVRRDVPVMILASLLVAGLSLDGAVGRGDALLLVVLLAAWTARTLRISRAEVRAEKARAAAAGEAAEAEPPRSAAALAGNLLLAGAGFGMLVLGSDLLVDAAVVVARSLGVSELVVGLTIVAVGTSLPEIATSVMASFRGERDIAVGNVIGSNIFNLLAVLGAAGVAGEGGVPVAAGALGFDLPIMLGTAFACLPVFYAGGSITRLEGVIFLASYGAYILWLVLDSAGSPWLGPLRGVLLFGLLPLAAVVMGTLSLREWRARRAPGGGSTGPR